jgi:tRNA(Ile)-lysidine synthase
MVLLDASFNEFVLHHRLVDRQQSILLAVSGGIDSMVMLDLFSRIREQLQLRLSVIHVNHQLRGEESMEDERFVRDKSAEYGYPFFCERVETESYVHEHKVSKQVAARHLRYAYFERARVEHNADAVATAHQADDNAETVLLNILRGTGIRGLAGIPLRRDDNHIIRPLLFAARDDIHAYAREHNLSFREDSSNESTKYRRNLLRHKIIPDLQKRAPDIARTLNRISSAMRDLDEELRPLVDEAIAALLHTDDNGDWGLDIRGLSEDDFLRNEIFVELLNRLHVEPSEKKVARLDRLYMSPSGRTVELVRGCLAYRESDSIVFSRKPACELDIRRVEVGGNYDCSGHVVSLGNPEPAPSSLEKTPEVEYIDAERLGKHIVVRPWRAGDWFIPLGMTERKKLSDFFVDQKVPRRQKASIPVLESDGAIVWICGRRLDDRFKLTKSTKMAIRLTYNHPA